jgi:hypothetical protein
VAVSVPAVALFTFLIVFSSLPSDGVASSSALELEFAEGG